MLGSHTELGPLATLAVQGRSSSRHLLFDERLRLCGRQAQGGAAELVRPADSVQPLAFCGMHVISPRLLAHLEENGAFSIIQSYLRLAAQGEAVVAFRADAYYWKDLGKPQNLAEAARDFGTRWS
jgi:NDP-sugar pyrophosphorylase family protein